MKTYSTPFELRRNLNYIKINLYLMWKRFLEYKENSFIGIFEQIIYMVTYIVFFKTLSNHFGSTINWQYYDFILLLILTDLTYVLNGAIHWESNLDKDIQNGTLNLTLYRPINPISGYYFSKLSSIAIPMIIIDILSTPILITIFSIEIHNILLANLTFILITITGIILWSLISTLSFISYGLNQTTNTIYKQCRGTASSYPAQFFNRTQAKIISIIIPAFYITSLTIPLLRNYTIENLIFQITTLLTINIISLIFTISIWHYGLKKYEAFG